MKSDDVMVMTTRRAGILLVVARWSRAWISGGASPMGFRRSAGHLSTFLTRVSRYGGLFVIGCVMGLVWWPANVGAQGQCVAEASRPDTRRYTAPSPGDAHAPQQTNQQYYQRYRQPYQDVSRRGAALQNRVEIESLDRNVQRRQWQWEALRQKNHLARLRSSDPAESAQLRMDFDREQQSFDRWRKNMQQRRADAERRRHSGP